MEARIRLAISRCFVHSLAKNLHPFTALELLREISNLVCVKALDEAKIERFIENLDDPKLKKKSTQAAPCSYDTCALIVHPYLYTANVRPRDVLFRSG